MSEENSIRVGDFVVYTDRDKYVGTVSSIDLRRRTAIIKVVLTVNNEDRFEDLEVDISKLKKRTLG